MVLRYFGIRVSDLDKSVKFYTEQLGLKLKRKGTMYHGGKWVLLEDPRSHQRLELNWYPEESPYSTSLEPDDRLDHIGFKVQNPAATFRRLTSQGATPALAPTDKHGVKGIYYVEDPDGNWLELF